jgi:RNA polymerase II C-terminal domain phosphatase-like 3/4
VQHEEKARTLSQILHNNVERGRNRIFQCWLALQECNDSARHLLFNDPAFRIIDGKAEFVRNVLRHWNEGEWRVRGNIGEQSKRETNLFQAKTFLHQTLDDPTSRQMCVKRTNFDPNPNSFSFSHFLINTSVRPEYHKMDCPHDKILFMFCAVCGEDLHGNEARFRDYLERPGGLRVSPRYAEQHNSDARQRLVQQRKLQLVLDLDNTLIHTKHGYEPQTDNSDVVMFEQGEETFTVKFRPGLREFMLAVSQLFEVHAYTMGTEAYCAQITELIQSYVGQRVFGERISRETNARRGARAVDVHRMRKQLGIFQRYSISNEMVLIVDDNEEVWRDHTANLIQIFACSFLVSRFSFLVSRFSFLVSRFSFLVSRFSFLVRSLCSLTSDHHWQIAGPEVNAVGPVQPTNLFANTTRPDEYLNHTLLVLQELHARFFQDPLHADVTALLSAKRSNILRGCVLLFSHVIPYAQPPQSSWFWVAAHRLGATCVNEFTDDVTHLVAAKGTTKKVNDAIGKRVYMVHVSWLIECFFKWNHCSELDYPLAELPVLGKAGPPQIKIQTEPTSQPTAQPTAQPTQPTAQPEQREVDKRRLSSSDSHEIKRQRGSSSHSEEFDSDMWLEELEQHNMYGDNE